MIDDEVEAAWTESKKDVLATGGNLMESPNRDHVFFRDLQDDLDKEKESILRDEPYHFESLKKSEESLIKSNDVGGRRRVDIDRKSFLLAREKRRFLSKGKTK